MTFPKHRHLHFSGMEWMPSATAILIGIFHLALAFFLTRQGDDVTFSLMNGDPDYGTFLINHYLHGNGRLSDKIAPWILQPDWHRILLFVSNALFVTLFFQSILWASGLPRRKTLARMALLAIAVFCFGWEYQNMQWVCFTGYEWSVALGLSMTYCAITGNPDKGGWWRWCLLPLCVVAGGMTEGLGVSLSAGFCVYFICDPSARRLSAARKAMLIAFMCGALFTVCSPTYYDRALKLTHFTWMDVMIVSGALAFILVGSIILMLIGRRNTLSDLIRSPWIIFATAAIVATGVGLIGSYPGRPMWFSQVFSLVALAGIPAATRFRVPAQWRNLLCLLIFTAIIAHYSAILYWQKRLKEEFRDFVTQYQKSPTGVVYADYTTYSDLSPYLRIYLQNVPEPDNVHAMLRMNWGYGNVNNMNAAVAPAAARVLTPDSLPRPRRIGRYIVRRDRQPGTHLQDYDINRCDVAVINDSLFYETVAPVPSSRPGPYNAPVIYLYFPAQFREYNWE